MPRPDDPTDLRAVQARLRRTRERHAETYRLYRDLLRLRREDPVLRLQPPRRLDGAVLGRDAFVLRFFGEDEDRLLLVNLGADLRPAIRRRSRCWRRRPAYAWEVLWSSEDPRYGGTGTPPIYSERELAPARPSAILLRPEAAVPTARWRRRCRRSSSGAAE